MPQKKEHTLAKAFFIRVLLISGIMLAGIATLVLLIMMKDPPKAVEVPEPLLSVEVQIAQKENVPVSIVGFGQVRALNTVNIAAEIPGVVTTIHPRLEMGEVIPAGEVLFQIDRRDYLSNFEQAQAMLLQAENALERLTTQYAQDKQRLETYRRTRELAQIDYERVKKLYIEEQVGSQSGVGNAEAQYNEVQDAYDRINQAVAVYPNLLNEAEGALTAARAQRDIAEANLQRTTLLAPFNARIKMVQLKAGQYVRPGELVLAIADDSLLEISVPIDSRDARAWLDFETTTTDTTGTGWFGTLKPVACMVKWTEDKEGHAWTGTLQRVESFDPNSRTVTLAVRVDNTAQTGESGALPLVDGMFCEVHIPGKTMLDVVRLPRWAVTFEGDVYLANENDRLEVRRVEVLRTQGEESFVSTGIQLGERAIVTRLQSPIPNTRLNISAVLGDDFQSKAIAAGKSGAVQTMPPAESAQ